MRTRPTRKLVSSALGLLALGCLWFYFAPAPLGGSTSYVVTHGVSMEPHFHTGDLALVRSQGSYHVGEVVAYHNKELHTIVLHRIIGRDGSRYIFKGDNNDFVDFEHPAASQLIGALWIHIPGAGGTLQSIRSPALVGILIAAGILILTGAAFTRHRRRRGKQRRTGEGGARPSTHAPTHTANPAVGVLAIGTVALLPFVALALLAFTRAPAQRRPYKIPYKQSGTFSYSADAAPGPVYADDRAVTGDPLFTHVLRTVDLHYAYAFHATAPHSLGGKASLSAAIESTDGWRTTLALGAPTYFRGDRAVATGTLDLISLLALMRRVELTTGARGSETLTITPHVSVTGASDLVPIHATFSPEIKFALEEAELRPDAAGGRAGATEPTATSQFSSSSSGAATGARAESMFLSLGIARLSVGTARTIALVAIAILLAALLATLAFLQPILALVRPRGRDEAASIRARYGRLIVSVAHVSQLPGVSVIDVADMESLARIAEHYDRSILHETTGTGDAFWVTDESGQFRYAPEAAVAEQAVAAEPEVVVTKPHAVIAEPQAVAAAPQEALVAEPESEPEESHTIEFEPVPLEAALPNANSVRNGYQNSDENSHTNSVRNGYQNSDENGHANGVRNGYQNGDENATAEEPFAGVFVVPEPSAAREGEVAEEPYTAAFAPRESLAEEVYADEIELGAIGYGASRNGSAKRSKTSPSLPVSTGSSG
jgi:signal peptidase I